MNDTPETDAFQQTEYCAYDSMWRRFAQKLERERDEYYNELLTKRGLCKIQERVINDWKAEAERWRAIK